MNRQTDRLASTTFIVASINNAIKLGIETTIKKGNEYHTSNKKEANKCIDKQLPGLSNISTQYIHIYIHMYVCLYKLNGRGLLQLLLSAQGEDKIFVFFR